MATVLAHIQGFEFAVYKGISSFDTLGNSLDGRFSLFELLFTER